MNSSLDKVLKIVLMAIVFWLAAAASFSGFMTKWALLDGQERNGVQAMLQGTAHRPFIYRQLIPAIANFIDARVSEEFKQRITTKHQINRMFGKADDYSNANVRFRYLIVYYAAFFSLFASMFFLRQILRDTGASHLTAIIVPPAFALALPYVQTLGGYYYDNVEIFFLTMSFWFALRGYFWLLLLAVTPATLNKETFLFFIPALYPLLRAHGSAIVSRATIGVCALMAGVVNFIVKNHYSSNAGGAAEFHLLDNLRNYLNPRSYFQFEFTYGLPGPSGISFIAVGIAAAILYCGWRHCGKMTRQHLLVAGSINLPLFVFFAETGELRNLSFLFVGMIIVLAHAIDARSMATPVNSL